MTLSRRDFIAQASLATAGALLLPNFTRAATAKPISIQLWTVKDFMEKDAIGTIQKLGKMGYTAVEAFGGDYFKMGPKVFRKLVEDNGMKLLSAHVGLSKEKASDPTPADFQKSIDDAHIAGVRYIVVPWLAGGCLDSLDAVKQTAQYFNEYGTACNKAGIKFLFHNHASEFNIIGDKSFYEHLLTLTDPKLVNFEMDLYWVVYAGLNPVDIFKKHPNRFPLWHVKDMQKTKKETTEIGNGRIDFKTIFANAALAGLDFPIVEQEDFTGTSIESAKICLTNLKKLTSK